MLGLLYYKKLSAAYKWLLTYQVLLMISSLINGWAALYFRNSVWVGSFLIPVELLSIGTAYFYFIKENNYLRILTYLIPLMIACAIPLSQFFLNVDIMVYDVIPKLGLHCAFTVLPLLFFYQMILNPKIRPLSKDSIFWYVSGQFLFYTISFFEYSLTPVMYNLGVEMPAITGYIMFVLLMMNFGTTAYSFYLHSKENQLKNAV